MTLMDFEGVPTRQTKRVKFVPTIADRSAPKLATEINATGALDLTMFFRSLNPQPSQGTGAAPTKLGRRVNFQRLDRVEYPAMEMFYPHSPSGENADAINAARTLLTENLQGHLVVREGLDQDVAFATTQKVSVWTGRFGFQIPVDSGDDAFAEYDIKQSFVPQLPVVYRVAIVT